MKTNAMKMALVFALLLSTTNGTAWAAGEETTLTTQATQMDTYTASKGQTAVTSKTAADFSKFYGEANSQALAEGLRTGSAIKLTNPAPSGSTATTGATATTATTASTATFTPPTGSMGNGNVYISMALAQQQLTAAGITQPTAEQIQAAMMGGTLTTGGQPVQGVLQLRASGMGWGQIAKAYGTKLGPVISGMKSANTSLARTTTTTTGAAPTTAAGTTTTATGKTKGATGSGKSGIVTGAGGGANVVGGAKGSSGKSGIVTGAGGSVGGKSGIVTGAGGAGGGASTAGGAKGAHGAGIVSGGGGAGGGSQGKGYGKGGK